MIVIKPTDKIFSDSPNTGEKDCICSRCLKVIEEGEVPIRMWTENDKGKVDEHSKEYRFCEACQENNDIIKINRSSFAELLKNSEKNWSEDFTHENGNYINMCIRCDSEFLGHKRRVICKSCFKHD